MWGLQVGMVYFLECCVGVFSVVCYTICISMVFVTVAMVRWSYSFSVGMIGKNVIVSCVLYWSNWCGMLD